MSKVCKYCGAPLNSSFGDRLKLARLRAGYTQEELSSRLKLSRTTITNLECDKQSPTIKAVIAIAKILDVTTDWLLGLKLR